MLFVDTSFWFALARPRDGNHTRAVALSLANTGAHLVTSSAVMSETWTLLRRRAGHARAWRWLDKAAASPNVRIHPITTDIADEAWAWLRIHDERAYSFVDATSFALMRRLGIRDALAFDGDFAAAGFAERRP